MANWDAYSELLSRIRQEWNKAEEDIKYAEQVCANVVFPAIQELRYAGRRLVEALIKIDEDAPDEEIQRLISDAEFNCHRARHDAIDAATSKIALDHFRY